MIEDDDMRLAFFHPDDFGEVVTVTPDSGPAFDIAAIFDAKPVDTNSHDNRFSYKNGARPSGSGPTLRCRSSEFAKELAGRATVNVRSRDYTVFKVEHDGTGMAFIEIKIA